MSGLGWADEPWGALPGGQVVHRVKGLDFQATARRARRMSDAALAFSRRDAHEAAVNADALAAAGIAPVDKDGGYYRDEATVYAAEQDRRARRR